MSIIQFTMRTQFRSLAARYHYDPLIMYLLEDYCRLSHHYGKIYGQKEKLEIQLYRVQLDLSRSLQQMNRCTAIMEGNNRRIMALQRKVHVLRAVIAQYERDLNTTEGRRIPQRLLDTLNEGELSMETDSEVSESESEDLLNGPLI